MSGVVPFEISRVGQKRSWAEEFTRVDKLYASFMTLGVPSVGSSRIQAYRRAFADFSAAAKEKRHLTPAEAEALFVSLVEVRQLERIVAAVQSLTDPVDWTSRLCRLIAGTTTLHSATRHSSVWDDQFEMFIAAVAHLSALAVSFGEPDVIVTVPEGTFGLAAKRPRSMGKVGAHLRDGRKQIRRTEQPGVVALDLSYALYPGQCLEAPSAEAAMRFVANATEVALLAYRQAVRATLDQRGVLGIIAHVQVPVLLTGGAGVPPLNTCARWTLVPSATDNRAEWVATFARRCEVGLLGPLPELQ